MSTPYPPGFTASPEEPRANAPRVKPIAAGPAVVVHHHGAPAWLLLVLLAVLMAAAAWHFLAFDSHPAGPEADGVQVGRLLVPVLADALADGFDAAARGIEEGQNIRAADDTLKATFDKQRNAAFATLGGPFLGRIVPAGEEPKDEAHRHAFAQAHRAIANGLRGSR